MKKIIMFLTLLILVLSCGSGQNNEDINKTNPQGVEADDLQVIDGKVYRYGEEKAYSGKVITRDENDKIIMNNFLKIGVGAPVEIDKDLTESFGKGANLEPKNEQEKAK